MTKRPRSFWFIQLPGWLLLIYLVYAQGISAIHYELGVWMGTQEPASVVTDVGVGFWYGFAVGDLLTYIPILLIGLIGHLSSKKWGTILISAALGITVYWPVVCLASIVKLRDAIGWKIEDETPYWLVLILILFWGMLGLFFILKDHSSSKA